ncbi:hypothetical protein L2E82_24543 [Cichorium intybus]|uniref:Uncharacterized protein n=1 Tax=Cichorium intybus TaxID=13427 RepID=A0ACB9E0S0_CICIN|nr:hypothetical protein L2E82_24543 [Cichorium intybus]
MQVPKPIGFFLEAESDSKSVKQIVRLILSKFNRRQPGRTDNEWANMWRDLESFQEKAFPFVDLEYMLMEFCRGLLKAGKFSLDKNYLKGSGSLVLPTDKAKYRHSGSKRLLFLSFNSILLTKLDMIEALTVKLPRLGVTILPLQCRQIKDPMEIIKQAITTQNEAYLNINELIEIAKLLGLNSRDEISSVQEAIAREAAVAGDLQLAFDLCLVMAKKGHGPVHCDNDSIGELLHAWKDLDIVSQCENLTPVDLDDDLIGCLAKWIMEEEDVLGCVFLLNLNDGFYGVQIIEEQVRSREDYEEICSMMNLGMIYSLLHNSQELFDTDPSHLTIKELNTFYNIMEQECTKLSSVKDLNFKNIANLTGPNLGCVTNEVYAHVNENTVETLADIMKTLTGIYKDRVPEGLIPYPYVYGYYVSTSLTYLENDAKSNHHQTPDTLRSFINDLEVVSFLKITPSLDSGFDHLSHDSKWKDDLIFLLNFWLRLMNDLKTFVSSNDLEFSPDCVMICLESFVELVKVESIPTSEGWAAIFSYINFGLVGDVYTEILNFCRSMMFSGCRFKAIAYIYEAAISKFPLDTNLSDLTHLYLRILETILKDLALGSVDHQNLYRVLSSLSELEGDLDNLNKVRTVIWDELGKFSDDMEIPTHIRVRMLQVMQFITSTSSYRFTRTLIALKSTQLLSSIFPTLEVYPNDLSTIESTVSRILNLSLHVVSRPHINVLMGVLGEWEGLFGKLSVKEDDGGNDDWDEGWEVDEELIEKETRKDDNTLAVHALHECWAEIFKKLTSCQEADFTVFRRVILPCYLSELVKGNQMMLAGLIVMKIMGTSGSFGLVNVAQVSVGKFLEKEVEVLGVMGSEFKEMEFCEGLVNTIAGLRSGVVDLIKSALQVL